MMSHRLQVIHRRQRGFSLIELMIGLMLGLILTSAVVTLVVNSNRSYQELNESSRRLENGRYAIELLAEEVRLAGVTGRYEPTAALPDPLPDPCLTTVAALDAALSVAVQGYDAPTGNPAPSCISDAAHLDGTDILVVRRASSIATAAADLAAGEVYLQTMPGVYELDLASAMVIDPDEPAAIKQRDDSLAPFFKYRVDIFYISPCRDDAATATCDANSDDGNPIPTLTRLELVSNGTAPAFSRVPLVEGIENLQIDYGIDRNGDGAPNADGAPAYRTLPANVDEWGNVVLLQLHVLARNVEPSAGHDDEKTYDLGGAGTVGDFGDRYKRRVFTRAARVENRSSRREQP